MRWESTKIPEKSGASCTSSHQTASDVQAERGGFEPPVPVKVHRFLETAPVNPQAVIDKQVTELAIPVLPSGLPELVENDADLGRIVTVWPSLPEPVKRAIVALLEIES